MCWTSITGLLLATCNANILPKNILLSYNISTKYVSTFSGFLWLSLRCLYLCQSYFPMLQQWFRSWECLLSFPSSRSLWHWNALHCLIPAVQAGAHERGEALNRVMTGRCGKNLSKTEAVEGHTQIHTCILFEMWQPVTCEMADGGGGRGRSLRKKSTKNVQDSKRTTRSYRWLCTYL